MSARPPGPLPPRPPWAGFAKACYSKSRKYRDVGNTVVPEIPRCLTYCDVGDTPHRRYCGLGDTAMFTVVNSLIASVRRHMCQHRCIGAVAISTMVRYLGVDISTSVSQHRSGTSISASRHLYLGIDISTSSRTSTSLLGVAPPTKNGHAPPPRE